MERMKIENKFVLYLLSISKNKGIITHRILQKIDTTSALRLYPNAIDSYSIEPLSVLHSKLEFEW